MEDPMATTATLLSRRQVAALLGVTEAEVRTRDNLTFHPTKAADGSYRYEPQEVAAVLRGVAGGEPGAEPSGAVCGAAFELFKDAKSLPEAVIALKQVPSVIRGLRVEYDAMTSCLTIGQPSIETLAKILRGRPRDEAHLVELTTALSEQVQAEYRRGHEAGLADASDLGEIVDPSTGQKRPLGQADIVAATRSVAERWAAPASEDKKPLAPK
jgi:hypothetical protein